MSTDASSRPNDVALCHQIMESQQTTIADLQSRLTRLEHSFEQLLRSKYGPRSERVDPHQLDLFDQPEAGLDETDDAEPPPTPTPPPTPEPDEGITVQEHRRRGGGRNVLPDHLPREVIEHDLTEDEKCCPECGETRQRIGCETSDQLEFVPAQLKVIEHVRFKYACRTCQEHVSIAPPPHVALAHIGRLYAVEREAKTLIGEDGLTTAHAWEDWHRARHELRQEKSLPILEELHDWLSTAESNVLPKSPVGQAIGYVLPRWDGFVRDCQQGALSIDNNLSERMIRPLTIGRKNWMFLGSDTGGKAAAILYGVIASAKSNEVEPFADVRALLRELTGNGPADLSALLSDIWLKTHPESHRRWSR